MTFEKQWKRIWPAFLSEGQAAADARAIRKSGSVTRRGAKFCGKSTKRPREKWERESGINSVVDEQDIAQVIAKQTGIPVSRMFEGEAQKLLGLEGDLHNRVIGQEAAISAIAEAVRRSRAGVSDPNRPYRFVLVFGADRGGGKPNLAKALSRVFV